MENQEFKLIAKTFHGLEEVLAKELISLGANDVEIGNRMVSFTGDKEMLKKYYPVIKGAADFIMDYMQPLPASSEYASANKDTTP